MSDVLSNLKAPADSDPIVDLGRLAAECDLKAANPFLNTQESSAYAHLAREYRRKQFAILEHRSYPFSNVLAEPENTSELPPTLGNAWRWIAFYLFFESIVLGVNGIAVGHAYLAVRHPLWISFLSRHARDCAFVFAEVLIVLPLIAAYCWRKKDGESCQD